MSDILDNLHNGQFFVSKKTINLPKKLNLLVLSSASDEEIILYYSNSTTYINHDYFVPFFSSKQFNAIQARKNKKLEFIVKDINNSHYLFLNNKQVYICKLNPNNIILDINFYAIQHDGSTYDILDHHFANDFNLKTYPQLFLKNISKEENNQESIDLNENINSEVLELDESNHIMEESNDVLIESNHVLVESNDVLVESNHIMEESNDVLVESNYIMEESNDILVESNDVIIEESNDVIETSNDVMKTSNDVLVESNDVMETSNDVMETSNDVLVESNDVMEESNDKEEIVLDKLKYEKTDIEEVLLKNNEFNTDKVLNEVSNNFESKEESNQMNNKIEEKVNENQNQKSFKQMKFDEFYFKNDIKDINILDSNVINTIVNEDENEKIKQEENNQLCNEIENKKILKWKDQEISNNLRESKENKAKEVAETLYKIENERRDLNKIRNQKKEEKESKQMLKIIEDFNKFNSINTNNQNEEEKKIIENKFVNSQEKNNIIYAILFHHMNKSYKIPCIRLEESTILNFQNIFSNPINPSNVILKNNIAIEVQGSNKYYLIHHLNTKYLFYKAQNNLLIITNIQNRNTKMVKNKEIFKMNGFDYLLTNNCSLLVPMENKKYFDNNYGTTFNTLIPRFA